MPTTLIKKTQLLLEDFLQKEDVADWTSDELGVTAAAIAAYVEQEAGETYNVEITDIRR